MTLRRMFQIVIGIALETDAVIGDGNDDVCIGHGPFDSDGTAHLARLQTVLDGIFNNRLERQRRNAVAENSRIDIMGDK